MIEILSASLAALSQGSHYPTPSDCVGVRYLAADNYLSSPVVISPNGSRVAYLLYAPDTAHYTNRYQLYVKRAGTEADASVQLIASSEHISQPQWLEDGRRLAYLTTSKEGSSIYLSDAMTGKQTLLLHSASVISEYSIDAKGETIAYGVESAPALDNTVTSSTPQDFTVLAFSRSPSENHTVYHDKTIYVRRKHNTQWSEPRLVTVVSPFSGKRLSEFAYYQVTGVYLSLSPDGHVLLFSYYDFSTLPEAWKNNYLIALRHNNGYDGVPLLMRYDVDNHTSRLAAATPQITTKPAWSPDSTRYAIVSESPIGSPWEATDNASKPIGPQSHVFVVRDPDSSVQLVTQHVVKDTEPPLAWNGASQLLLRASQSMVTKFTSPDGEAWRKDTDYSIPLPNYYRFAKFTARGDLVVADYQNLSTPPELVMFRLGDAKYHVLANLNPEFENLSLARTMPVKWTLNDLHLSGILFLPPDYTPGKRYPLVIQTHDYLGGFACDNGVGHYPSYAPQPLAAAGIMYLMQTNASIEEIKHYRQDLPGKKGYGGLAEAAYYTDMWDAAVDELVKEGLVDRNRIGVTGFSRKAWYSEYMLTHGRTHYTAAISTDNIHYSTGERWLKVSPTQVQAWDAMYGGPPSGNSLQAWVDHSISFDLEKVATPLLMEVHGYGQSYSTVAIPAELAGGLEVYVGLRALRKPVELIYYPAVGHVPDDTRYRIENITRTVDWFRFWLQGYKRPNPEDPDQYKRWEHLREMQDADDKASVQPSATPLKPMRDFRGQ